MEFEYLVDGAVQKVAIEVKEGIVLVREGEKTMRAEIVSVSDAEIFLSVDGVGRRIFMARDGGRWLVFHGGGEYVLEEPRKAESTSFRGEDGGKEGGLVKAPMPGKVIKVLVAEGEAVRKNQTLLIVEAMKMENEIKAGRECVVRKVHVAAGDLVDAARPLVELE